MLLRSTPESFPKKAEELSIESPPNSSTPRTKNDQPFDYIII